MGMSEKIGMWGTWEKDKEGNQEDREGKRIFFYFSFFLWLTKLFFCFCLFYFFSNLHCLASVVTKILWLDLLIQIVAVFFVLWHWQHHFLIQINLIQIKNH